MNERDLLTEALARTDAAERAAFLDGACKGEPELRRRLEERLAGRTRGDGGLEGPETLPVDPAATAESSPDATSGEQRTGGASATLAGSDHDAAASGAGSAAPSRRAGLPSGEGLGTVVAGRYTLVEVIGEGGMGSVYLASQSDPVKRRVALKLIRTGMDSRGVLARFDAERQALALMDHPNIARIYDGGATPAGQPFFVMELVKGTPITEYCDERRLSVQARLELFIAVCQAVQHAHQKGIIHRDLKPGNVLVTEVDGRPTPKVIDFGVAKAVEVKLTDMSFADTGAIVGTPAYMSPEQADPSSMDIDTRTDVYALGVMLYELLTGSPPIDASQFRRGAILEMLRMVREVDPPRPSTRLSTAEALPNIAANRSIEPARLARLLRGEIDWVVMKALEKDRSRRYDTVNGLARDLQRYLADEMVEARPPSAAYRLRKLLRRNRGTAAATAAIAATLVLAAGVSLWFGVREAKQRAEAVRLSGIAEANAAAEVKARKRAEAISAFVIRALNASDAMQAGKKDATIAEAMVGALADLESGAFANDPETEARLRETIGIILKNNAEYERARPLLERALALTERLSGPDSVQAATSLEMLGTLLVAEQKYDQAEPLYARSLAILEKDPKSDEREMAVVLNSLAALHYMRGRHMEAEPLFLRASAIRERVLGPEARDLAVSLNDLALVYNAQRRFDEAERLMKRSMAIFEKTLGPHHPNVAASLNSLAMLQEERGLDAQAEPLYLRALAICEKANGPDHPLVATGLHNLAENYRVRSLFAQAEPLYARALAIREEAHGPDHPEVGIVLGNFALSLKAAGKYAQAEPLYSRSLAIDEMMFGPDHPDVATDLNNLGMLYEAQDLHARAEPLLKWALDIRERSLGPDHAETAMSLSNLAMLYEAQGRHAQAESMLLRALAIAAKAYGPEHPRVAVVLALLARARQSLGETAEARKGFDAAVAMLRRRSPDGSLQLAQARWQSAKAHLENKEPAAALPEIEEAVTLAEKLLPPGHPQLAKYRETLSKCKAATEASKVK
ncbi:tetratricopeptide repeat protein [Paludisphaera mucosa]|uniref:Serine/threonine-protein kinase n=1 Tax=Paludisphaera mucosa TaxID=3030827 RepID=A0ABT6FLA0_9BACT|nr:serine/threonine-protein kinase [Paludisphaera mucosa]